MPPPQIQPPIQQLQPPGNHQIGAQQISPVHVPPPGVAAGGRHIPPPQQNVSSQIPQQAPPVTQIGLPPMPQSHLSPSTGPVAPGAPGVSGGTVGLPLQMRSQPQQPPVNTQGQQSQIPAHVSSAAISSQPSQSVIQVPGGTVAATGQALPQTSGIPPAMQGMTAIPAAAQSMSYQSPPPPPPPPPLPSTSPPALTAGETSTKEENAKPTTAELISFD